MSATAAPPAVTRWAHQQAAYEFTLARWRGVSRGVMLAIAMGGGKSKIAIDLAECLEALSILILCPLRVVEVWRLQFEKFAAGRYRFLALDERHKSVYEKARAARMVRLETEITRIPSVIAVNYDSARAEPFASWALGQMWDLTIADESHRLKNAQGRTSRFAAQLGLRSRYKLALTGTPMAHEPTDIWGQFRFLAPGLLDPTFSGFRSRYAIMGGYGGKQVIGWQNLDLLEADFRKIAFQVDSSVLDLPPELDETLSTTLSEKGAQIYTQMEEELSVWLGTGEATAANAMVKLLRLQQITGGTLTDENGRAHRVDHEKQKLLGDLLEDLDEPVVVFARFRADLEAIHETVQEKGWGSFELSGTRDEIAAWREDPHAVLAVQIQAGGVGIDLTHASIAIYYSLGFSLVDYVQSRARIRRPPQQRPCRFYHLEIRHSIDTYVMRAIEARADLIDTVLKTLKEKRSSP